MTTRLQIRIRYSGSFWRNSWKSGPEGGDDPIDIFGTKFKSPMQEWRDQKTRIEETLALHGLKYLPGGKIVGSFESTPINSIRKALANADMKDVDVEFERTM